MEENNIIIRDREKIQLTGVVKIESFNEETFILETKLGLVQISGTNLEVLTISIESGEISIKGYVTKVEYSDYSSNGAKKEGFLKKLFK